MTIKKYCELTGVTKSAVSYRLKNNLPLPGVTHIDKVNRRAGVKDVYRLTVSKELKEAKKFFRQKTLPLTVNPLT